MAVNSLTIFIMSGYEKLKHQPKEALTVEISSNPLNQPLLFICTFGLLTIHGSFGDYILAVNDQLSYAFIHHDSPLSASFFISAGDIAVYEVTPLMVSPSI